MNRTIAFLGAALLPIYSGATQPPPMLFQPAAVDRTYLTQREIPTLPDMVSALKVTDRHGEHVLTLVRQASPSPRSPNSGRDEQFKLTATFYSAGPTGKWTQTWTIRDRIDCPGLDADANFFVDSVTFSDVNANDRLEVTVPYYLQCTGGIEPRTIKIILREGPAKFAIRGESEVRLPGQQPFGGEHTHDKSLLDSANRALRQHMEAIWAKVSIDR